MEYAVGWKIDNVYCNFWQKQTDFTLPLIVQTFSRAQSDPIQ